MPADDAVAVLDAVLDAGRDHGIRPFGEEALNMLRIEAGLPLVDVEWHDSRTAWTDADRVTPTRARHGLDAARRRDGSRPLRRQRGDPPRAGRAAPPGGRPPGSSSTGRDWDRLHRDAGLLPTKDEHPLPYES